MTCRETTMDALTEYVDGRLADAARAALVRHLDACAGCRGQVRWLEAVKAAAAGAPAPAMPAGLKTELLAQARAASRRKAARLRREWWQSLLRPAPVAGLGLAAGFAAAMVVLAVRSSAPVDVPLDEMLAAHRAYEMTMPLNNSEATATGLAEALAGGRP